MIHRSLLKNIQNTLKFDAPKGANVEDLIYSKQFNEIDVFNFKAEDYSFLIGSREYQSGFKARLLYRYSRPMQDLEIFIERCRSIGKNTYDRIEKGPKSSKSIAIRRLHQKACLLASEILYLLKGGFPSAALSIWRTALETSTISIFLAINDELLSERYLDYEIVEKKKEMGTYIRNSKYLGFEELSEEQQCKINTKYSEIKNKYGNNFCKNLGWANSVIDKPQINLHDLMDNVNFEYMKPFYKFANNYIHGGPKSLLYNLGYIDGVLGEETIAGASNIGFVDPAQLCALSFLNTTIAFLSLAPEEKDFVALIGLYSKINGIAEGFAKEEANIKKEELKTNIQKDETK